MGRWFDAFNALCFANQLPRPALKCSRSRTRLGSMSYKRGRLLGLSAPSGFVIRLSTYYCLTEEEYQDVLLHEMVHYRIAFERLRDSSPHGPLFRRMMEDINRRFGRHLTVSAPRKSLLPAEEAPHGRVYLLLFLVRKDGKHFLAVVNPRSASRLERLLKKAVGIVDHAWRQSDDGRFAAWPAVRSLRARPVSVSDFRLFMAASAPIRQV